jgi:hypothetical protein
MPTTAEVRTVAVGGQRLRVAITSGPNGPGRERRPDHPAGQRAADAPAHPDSRLHVYPGGHLGLLTEAAGLAPVVDGFLAGP